MATNLVPDILKGTTYVFGSPDFNLGDMDGFPYLEYTELQEKYSKKEEWLTGTALDETQNQGDKVIEIYPLKINPIKLAAFKHSSTLWGEFPDDFADALIMPRVVIDNDYDKELSDSIEDTLERLWANSNGAAIMIENSVISQIYGGCVFKVSFVENRDPKVLVERIHVKEFIGIPTENDYWNLKEAWIVRKIDMDEAKDFGVTISSKYAYYIEYWTKEEFSIRINESVLQSQASDGSTVVHAGPNPFGFVPFVYIPHDRTGVFYGEGIVSDSAIGITKEINLRVADSGDATSDESHSILAMRNVRGTPKPIRLPNGIIVLDLGSGQSIGGKESPPDLFSVTRSSVTEPMLSLNRDLRNEIRRELYVPAVADGEDEGSQRSAATLIMRMWPLTSHIKSERAYWSTGLNILHKMALKIMSIKGIDGVNERFLKPRLRCKWHPILPRDRQAFVEELVARAGVNLGSIEHLLSLIGDVDDVDLVMEQIKDWIEFTSSAGKIGEMEDGSESNSGGSGKTQRDGGRKVSSIQQGSSNQRPQTERTRQKQSRTKSDN